jgi:hypothetical protein
MIEEVRRMFACLECGHIFSEDDVATWEESRGEYWGTPCYEEVNGCPKCGGSYAKTYECSCCGKYITDDYVKVDDERYCSGCYLVYELGEEDS